MEILTEHLYDFEEEPVLVVSVVDGIVICVKATSSAKEKDWLLVPTEKFAALAKHRGEFFRKGTYKLSNQEEYYATVGSEMLYKLFDIHNPCMHLTFTLAEIYTAIHGNDPELVHIFVSTGIPV